MGETLKGKVAVVTGSGQGIGRAIAVALGKEGASLVTNNRKPGSTGFVLLKDKHLEALSDEQREWLSRLQKDYSGDAETTSNTIKEQGGEAVPFFGDISNYEVAGKLIQAAVDTYGKIDVLVNVAGGFGFSPVWELTEELWDYVTRIKPKGYFNTIRHAAPLMMEQKWGRILNCTSRAWSGDPLSHAEYATANAGVVGLTRAVASELYPYGVTCNAFSPFARTRASFELIAYNLAMKKEGFDSSLEMTPVPDGIGPIIVFLASEAAADVSGSVFEVSGNSAGIFSEPEVTKKISKPEGGWTVEEIMKRMPEEVLLGYTPHVASLTWGR